MNQRAMRLRGGWGVVIGYLLGLADSVSLTIAHWMIVGSGNPNISVLSFSVTPQVNLALETSTAQVTVEWFVSRVFSTMGDEVGGLAERFSTNDAFMRLFTRVDVSVLFHVRLLVEPLPAVLAWVGPCV